MDYRLLAVSKYPNLGVNIGDYVQALASAQFYPRVDGFLDRDEDLKAYNGPFCKMIMNGWYMHEPSNWPPSDHIVPLFVALHLNSTAKDKMLSTEGIDYLRKYAPIGCRDTNTLELLKQNGIEAYFSGCMTLTLGKNFHSDVKDGQMYIVDPQMNCDFNMSSFLKASWEIVRHPLDILKLCRIKNLRLHHGRNLIKKVIKTALYHLEYCKLFDRNIVMGANYVCQEDESYRLDFTTDEARLKEAERLVRLYAKARLVITSRIHCALPCLGLETPVIYLEKEQDSEESSCRMGGLIDLFNVVKVDKGALRPAFNAPQHITVDNFPENKHSWKPLAKSLCERCQSFMSE